MVSTKKPKKKYCPLCDEPLVIAETGLLNLCSNKDCPLSLSNPKILNRRQAVPKLSETKPPVPVMLRELQEKFK